MSTEKALKFTKKLLNFVLITTANTASTALAYEPPCPKGLATYVNNKLHDQHHLQKNR